MCPGKHAALVLSCKFSSREHVVLAFEIMLSWGVLSADVRGSAPQLAAPRRLQLPPHQAQLLL